MKTTSVDSIILRPVRGDDYTFVLKWSKDDRFCLANGWELNRDEIELRNWWLSIVNNTSEDFIRLGIEYNNSLIGYVDLASIKDDTAELGIAIGNSKLWGKGLGYVAACHMIHYAAKELSIINLKAETHEKNIRSIKMLEKLGFKEISRNGFEAYLETKNLLIQYKLNLSNC